MKKNLKIIFSLLGLIFLQLINNSCTRNNSETRESNQNKPGTGPALIILGTIQDGGSPHIGCKKLCCKELFLHPDHNRKVVSLGILDPESHANWLIEATPDITIQLKMMSEYLPDSLNKTAGIFLTHAHIGHYSGLMYLGREAMNSKDLAVYAMPRMKIFLEENGPWSQLVKLRNIIITAIKEDEEIKLSEKISVTAFRVPHRDEFSETVGYKITGPKKQVLFIPDIDKWAKWNKNIIDEIKKVDLAIIDGTFYDSLEIQNRNMSEIPHPFVTESMRLFESLPVMEKKKIMFIHFNHTNPLLDTTSKATREVIENGFQVAKHGMLFLL